MHLPLQYMAHREYNIALRTELKRKEAQSEDPKRAAELAAYFTQANLQRPHVALTLRSAMATFARLKNYNTCATFCRRLLELNAGQKVKAPHTSARASGFTAMAVCSII